MKKSFVIFLFGMFSIFTTTAQNTIVKGSVNDATTGEPLQGVTVTVEDTDNFEKFLIFLKKDL